MNVERLFLVHNRHHIFINLHDSVGFPFAYRHGICRSTHIKGVISYKIPSSGRLHGIQVDAWLLFSEC